MEQNRLPQEAQDGDDLEDDLTDEAITNHVMEALHLPPGLDLLFQMLDEMSGGSVPPTTEKMTPTPYFRTPSLGS